LPSTRQTAQAAPRRWCGTMRLFDAAACGDCDLSGRSSGHMARWYSAAFCHRFTAAATALALATIAKQIETYANTCVPFSACSQTWGKIDITARSLYGYVKTKQSSPDQPVPHASGPGPPNIIDMEGLTCAHFCQRVTRRLCQLVDGQNHRAKSTMACWIFAALPTIPKTRRRWRKRYAKLRRSRMMRQDEPQPLPDTGGAH